MDAVARRAADLRVADVLAAAFVLRGFRAESLREECRVSARVDLRARRRVEFDDADRAAVAGRGLEVERVFAGFEVVFRADGHGLRRVVARDLLFDSGGHGDLDLRGGEVDAGEIVRGHAGPEPDRLAVDSDIAGDGFRRIALDRTRQPRRVGEEHAIGRPGASAVGTAEYTDLDKRFSVRRAGRDYRVVEGSERVYRYVGLRSRDLGERGVQVAAVDGIVEHVGVEAAERLAVDVDSVDERSRSHLRFPIRDVEPIVTGPVGVFEVVSLAERAGVHHEVQHVLRTALHFAERDARLNAVRTARRHPCLVGFEQGVVFTAGGAFAGHQHVHLGADAPGVVSDVEEIGGAFTRPPVGHEGAGPAPLAAQDGGVEVVVVVVPEAVDLVVAAHDVVGPADLHADLERPEVDLAEGAFGAARIVVVAVGLLVVQREVLRHGGRAGGLDAARHGRRHQPGEERVFGEILEVASAERVAVDVHAGAEDAVDAVQLHLLADLVIHRFDQLVVPCAGEQGADRQERGVRGEAQPGGAVAGRDGRHALVADALEDAAEDGGVSGGSKRAVHAAVAAEQRLHFSGRELGDEFVERVFAVLHVDELDALVAGLRHGLREAFLHAGGEVDLRDRDAFPAGDEFAVLLDRPDAVERDAFRGDREGGFELFDHDEVVEFSRAGKR